MKLGCSWILAGWLLAGISNAAVAAPPPQAVASSPAPTAHDGPPSDESLRKLLETTRARALLDSMRGQIDAFMKEAMDTALRQGAQGKALTAQQQAVLDHMRDKMTAIVTQSMNWEQMEQLYLRVYRASFTQSEVDDLTAFYETPAGQALLTKMPLVMQNLFGEMRGMMQSLQQQMLEVQKETVRELQNLPSVPQTKSG